MLYFTLLKTDVKADSSWPSSKAVSHSNSTGSLSDLDQTPAKGGATKRDVIELKESPIKGKSPDEIFCVFLTSMISLVW